MAPKKKCLASPFLGLLCNAKLSTYIGKWVKQYCVYVKWGIRSSAYYKRGRRKRGEDSLMMIMILLLHTRPTIEDGLSMPQGA